MVNYASDQKNVLPTHEDHIVAALAHPDRVCRFEVCRLVLDIPDTEDSNAAAVSGTDTSSVDQPSLTSSLEDQCHI